MPRLQVYLPDDLHDELKRSRLPAFWTSPADRSPRRARTAGCARRDSDVSRGTRRRGRRTRRPATLTHADTIERRIRERGLGQAGLDVLILDSGGVTRLSSRNKQALALIRSLVLEGLWPPIVLTMVLVESLHGDPARDANTNRFLKTCIPCSPRSRPSSLGELPSSGVALEPGPQLMPSWSRSPIRVDRSDGRQGRHRSALAAHARRVSRTRVSQRPAGRRRGMLPATILATIAV